MTAPGITHVRIDLTIDSKVTRSNSNTSFAFVHDDDDATGVGLSACLESDCLLSSEWN